MKKIVRLTESELKNIVEASVRRAIKEGVITEGMVNEGLKDKALEVAKVLGISLTMALALLADFGNGGPISKALERRTAEQAETGRAFPEDRAEYGDQLNPGGGASNDSTAVNTADAQRGLDLNSRIRGAVMESIKNLMNEDDGVDKLADRERSFKRMAHLNPEPDDKEDKE